MMQLDLLKDDAATTQETTAVQKKARRPQRHFNAQEEKTESVLPSLPQSLRPPFVLEEAVAEKLPEAIIEKAPGAFKTISETAKFLGVPQHVLRFWESRFSQIKPLKLNGGRRYYRPQDIDILTTIKHLLYKQGYTIKGAKKAFNAEKHHAPVMTMDKSAADKSQLSIIRQELIELRDSLRSCLAK